MTRTFGLAAALALGCALGCSRPSPSRGTGDAVPAAALPDASAREQNASLAGFAQPIAAIHRPSGDVVAVGLDPAARALRIVRIASGDRVTASAVVLEDVEPSPEADVKLLSAADGFTVVWRGRYKGALVRKAIGLNERLVVRRAAVDVGAAFCSTRDAFVHIDGGRAEALHYQGGIAEGPLGGDGAAEASVVCGAKRAFVLLERDDDTRVATFGASDDPRLFTNFDSAKLLDAGDPTKIFSVVTKLEPKVLLRERDFGKDELRERADITIGDELAVVRVGTSGAVNVRETKNGEPGPLTKLKTPIRQDDDVVAVDGTDAMLVIVYTTDAGDACPDKVGPWTKVKAIRVDRATHEETPLELAEGACGHELGPFSTSRIKDGGVEVTWVDRVPTQGRSRAPIAGFSHAPVTKAGAGKAVHVAEPAEALASAGCDGSHCWMVSLRHEGGDASASSALHVRAYAP